MCLRNPIEARTGNKLYTRYKVVSISDKVVILSPFYDKRIRLSDWQDVKAKRNFHTDYLDAYGYHVYVDIRAAQKMLYGSFSACKIVKIQTKYRVATGNFRKWKSEIWRTYKILKFVGTPDAKELNKKFGYK
jgi:hypothetical protein